MIEISEIRKQVAIKHNVLLEKDDPILVTVTINELVLSRYLDLANEHYSEANRELIVALQQQQEQAKEVAGRIITDASDYVSEQVRTTINDMAKVAANDISAQLRQQFVDMQTANGAIHYQDAQIAKDNAIKAIILAGASVVLAVITLLIAVLMK